jgi:hypothetical protein
MKRLNIISFAETYSGTFRAALTTAAAALICSGCALGRKAISPGLVPPDTTYHAQVTHRDQVLADLGPPLKITRLSNGYVFMYESIDTRELQLGFSIPIPVINWFKIVTADADYNHHVMLYQFDRQHRLVAWDDESTHFDLGDSLAIQPVISVQFIFDTSNVEFEKIDAAQWPAYSLLPLPQALNRAQAVNTGVAGVEQRGTATYIGQRSVELHQ